MSRKHDKRARRPPLVPEENGGALDIRAGKQRQELGRNPRGETAPVNEKSARYKKAQAHKFAEHGSDKRQDAHRTGADMGDSAMSTNANIDNSIIEQSNDIRAVSRNEGQPVSSFGAQDAPKTPDASRIDIDTGDSAVPARVSTYNPVIEQSSNIRATSRNEEQPVSSSGVRDAPKTSGTNETDADTGNSIIPTNANIDIPIVEQSTNIRAVSRNEGQPVSSSDVQETPKTSGTKTIPAETAKGSVIPNDSSSAHSALSHERPPRSKQKRQEQLQHNRSGKAAAPQNKARRKNKNRSTAKFSSPDEIKTDKMEAAVVTTAPSVVADTEKSGAELYIIRHERQDESPIDLVKKQPENSPQSEVQPSTEETLPESQTPSSDKIISHERNSQVTHERPSWLRHSRTPIISADPTRRKQKYSGDVSSKQDNDKQTIHESAADLSEERENYDADWRRADDTAKLEDTPPETDAQTESDADSKASDGGGNSAPTDDSEATESEAAENEQPADTPSDSKKKPPPSERGSRPVSSENNIGKPEKKPRKLKFEDEATTPQGKKAGRKLDKTINKAERSSGKLDKAREKLPAKRKLRINREFDAEKGKLKPKIRFEKEVKTQREYLKGAPVTRPIKLGASAAVNFAHVKMFQAEDDNVAVKAAHRSELIAERGARSAYSFAKNTPYRRVQKLQEKTAKLSGKVSRQKIKYAKSEIKGKAAAKKMQKKMLKKQYAKAAREAKKTGQVTAKLAVKIKAFAVKAGAKLAVLLANPKVWIIGGILALIIIIILGMVSACSSMFSGIGSSVTAMSYLSESDADIDDAELYYTEMETDLRILIANVETDYPDYDEYIFGIDGVGHDPFMLIAFLTAVYQDFTFADIKPVLEDLFGEQYVLELTPSVELRTRTETFTGTYTDDDGEEHTYIYTEEAEYEWHILTVTLTSKPLFEVIFPRMDVEQLGHYYLLMQSKGLRQHTASPFAFDWMPFVSSNYGYRIHPITGAKDYHLGIDIALPAGTEILAAHTGTVTFAGDLGGYGYVAVIEDSGGLVTKYAHCAELFVSAGQTVAAGDVIAAVGSTGDSTGPHLHFEVIREGRYLNPLFFALTSYY